MLLLSIWCMGESWENTTVLQNEALGRTGGACASRDGRSHPPTRVAQAATAEESQPGHYPELHCNRTFRAVPLRSLLQVYIQAAIISGEKKVPFLAVYCGFSSLCLLKPRHCRKDEQFPQISLCVVLFLIIQLCPGQQSNKYSHLTEL